MIVIIRKRHLALAAAALCAVCVIAYLLWQPAGEAPVFAAGTVVVDAGHGGADGGAVASDGTAESGINLAITVKVREMLLFLGRDVTLTRTDDQGLYNDDTVTIRQKKVADTVTQLFPEGTLRITGVRKADSSKHIFSHIEWHMGAYAVEIEPAGRRKLPDGYVWAAPAELKTKYSLPSAFAKWNESTKEQT